MNNGIPIARTLRIRECGFDEFWLQDQIAGNPACLGLGELEVITRERQQSSGGRLDILMKDPEDDSMYEVEVMMGDTDEHSILDNRILGQRKKKMATTSTFCSFSC